MGNTDNIDAVVKRYFKMRRSKMLRVVLSPVKKIHNYKK